MSLSQYNGKTLRGLSKVLLGLALFVFADAAIFRSDWYTQYLAPDSSAGISRLTLLRERQHQTE